MFDVNSESMIRCLIVDDEPLALDVLENYISKTSGLELAGRCINAIEAFDQLHKSQIHLIFLDIRMPGLSGIDFIKSLKHPPSFIFTTAYSEFAVVSYELDAVDYLLKPILYERFQVAIQKYLKQTPAPESEKTYSYFKVNGKLVKISYADIVYIQSIKDYIMIYTTKGNFITHMTMKFVTDMLSGLFFKRVHRSFLINVTRISSLSRTEIKLGDVTIPIGENYRVEVNEIKLGLP